MEILKLELFMENNLGLVYSFKDWDQWLNDMLMTPVRLCSVEIQHANIDFENVSLQEIDKIFPNFE